MEKVSVMAFTFWGDQNHKIRGYDDKQRSAFVDVICEIFTNLANCMVWSITEGCLVVKVIPLDAGIRNEAESNMAVLKKACQGKLLNLVNTKMAEMNRSPYESVSVQTTERSLSLDELKRKRLQAHQDILQLEEKPSVTFNARYDMTPFEGFVGKAYIFNNENFDQPYLYPRRKGTDMDVRSLETVFLKLGLDVRTYKDYTTTQFEKEIQSICAGDSSKNDKCVVVAVMSHGTESKIRMKDDEYDLKKLFKPFAQSEIFSNKPKIFFLQACQGNQFNLKEVQMDSVPYEVDGSGAGNTAAPNGSDILVCHATTPGFQAFRNVDKGSWFMQKIHDVFTKYLEDGIEELDLVQLMTVVSQTVASKEVHQDVETGGIWNKLKLKQMPSFVSTLRKRVVFERRFTACNDDSDDQEEKE